MILWKRQVRAKAASGAKLSAKEKRLLKKFPAKEPEPEPETKAESLPLSVDVLRKLEAFTLRSGWTPAYIAARAAAKHSSRQLSILPLLAGSVVPIPRLGRRRGRSAAG